MMAQFLRPAYEQQSVSLCALTVFSFHKRLAVCKLSVELYLFPVNSWLVHKSNWESVS